MFNAIEEATKGVGVAWVHRLDRTYDVARMRETLKEALATKEKGPKVIIARGCEVSRSHTCANSALYQPSWREARSFMISSVPPPMASTLVSR